VYQVSRKAGSVVLIVLALMVAGQAPSAQAPRAPALGAAALADSIRLIDSLSAVVRANPRNAAAWLHRGNTALRLVILASSRRMPPGLDEPRTYRIAHESLTRARELDSENPDVWTALARLQAMAGGPFGPSPLDYNYEAFLRARTSQDSVDFAELALRLGLSAFAEYEGFAERAQSAFEDDTPTEQLAMDIRGQRGIPPPNHGAIDPERPPTANMPGLEMLRSAATRTVGEAAGTASVASLPVLLFAARDSVLATMWQMPFDAAGERQYLVADTWLERAYRANPTDDRTFRAYAKVLAARARWLELGAVARQRIGGVPNDPWGWMALGVSQQRSRLTRDARVALDSALARFGADERARVDRLDRVLRNGDAVLFRRADSASRARTTSSSWLLSDPLWSNDDEDPRTEFLARVGFAELRWSWNQVRGADSPRGDIYVRYGPPDTIIGPFWLYDSGPMFAFTKGPTAANLDGSITAQIRDWQPSRWDNVSETRIDSMPVQVARFRGPADSVDVLIASRSPLDSLRTIAGVTTEPRVDLWLYGWDTPHARRDSVVPESTAERRWTYRVPSGTYYYRIESTVPGGLMAGRAAGTATVGPDSATGFTTRGFGISDVLLATTADAPAHALRWTDMEFVPLMGAVAAGGSLAVVWETYDLTRVEAEARYTVTISLARERSRGGRIAAVIATRIGTLVGINRSDDELAATFDRVVPHAGALADLLTIELGETPPGSYRLTLSVTDGASGAVTTRATRVVVR
jgi:GWxTD domain-containing protein